MRKIIILIIFLPVIVSAQIYNNVSSNLPDNGAKKPSMDVKAVDIDTDGDLDIILANEFQGNTILINDGLANFTNSTIGNLPQPIHDSEDVVAADFNMDGHIDLLFCSEDDVVHEYYWGDGSGSFSIAGFTLPNSTSNAVVTADFNNDSIPDLLFGNAGQNVILINDGAGNFTNETNIRLPSNNNTTQDLALADIDGDNDIDIFVGNEDGNKILINDGTGVFSDESITRLPQGLNIETRKASFGDVDGDNDMDLFLSNVRFIPLKDRQNRLWINDGNGNFADSTSTHLPSDNEDTLDGIFVDVDGDNDLDIVVANVNLAVSGALKVYANYDAGHFVDESASILPESFFINALGVIAEDFNGDGQLDLYFCDRNIGNNFKDVLLIRENPTSIIPIEELMGIKIFPNPVVDTLSFEWSESEGEITNIQIVDLSGKVMLENISFSIESDRVIQIRKLNLPAGTYLLKTKTTQGEAVGKFIVN